MLELKDLFIPKLRFYKSKLKLRDNTLLIFNIKKKDGKDSYYNDFYYANLQNIVQYYALFPEFYETKIISIPLSKEKNTTISIYKFLDLDEKIFIFKNSTIRYLYNDNEDEFFQIIYYSKKDEPFNNELMPNNTEELKDNKEDLYFQPINWYDINKSFFEIIFIRALRNSSEGFTRYIKIYSPILLKKLNGKYFLRISKSFDIILNINNITRTFDIIDTGEKNLDMESLFELPEIKSFPKTITEDLKYFIDVAIYEIFNKPSYKLF